MIRGYAEQPSPRAGEHVVLHVATDAPQFRVELYRCTDRMALRTSSSWLPGADAPLHLPFHDWGDPGVGLRGEDLAPWPAHELAIPADAASGVYVAVLVEGDGVGHDRTAPDRTTPDGRDARALFVVRPAASQPSAPILYKVPLLTYHAYNLVEAEPYDPAAQRGHWCLYNMPRPQELPIRVPPAVGLHRPGGGTGGAPYDIFNVDPFDPTARQTFVHWDHRFIQWMERAGYIVDYCTDVDLHRDGAQLVRPYRLLVSAGHDEYWSDAMRDAVEGHVVAGGNVAFFGGNTAWWRVVFHDDVTFSRVHVWSEAPEPARPENTMTGVSFRNGGERDCDDHPIPVGYRVQHADHWVYAGTGVRDGEVFGGGPQEYLVGYECDGADFDRAEFDRAEFDRGELDRGEFDRTELGRADPAAGPVVVPTGADGTPDGFTILAVGDTRPSGWGLGNCAATMGLHSRGGTVFTAATTDWPRVLTGGTSPVVEQVTRNVLDRLSASDRLSS